MNEQTRNCNFIMKKMQKISFHCLGFFFLFYFFGYSQQSNDTGYTDQYELPQGKIGEVVKKLITTVNSNDTLEVKSFVNRYFAKDFQNMAPMEVHQEYFLRIYRNSGGIIFNSIRSYNPPHPDETVVIVKNINFDSWQAFRILFNEDEDYLIKGINYIPARPPLNIGEIKVTKSDFLQITKDLIEKLCYKDVFSGTVLIAKGEEILFEKACGEASKRYHVANDINTKFNLGSINKMFTAVAIMQLVENGTIRLNDPIEEYVDESWLSSEITSKVTIHHLLTHTSGLGNYFNTTFWKGSRDLYKTIEDYKQLVNTDILNFEPGSRFEYSNIGMLLLGVVIEKSTGLDYFEYIRRNIYAPSKMENSDSYEMDQPVENLAIGYIPSNKNEYGWENNIYKHVIKGGPAGGGFSTVRDLHKFAVALVNQKLVSKSGLKQLWTDHYKSYYGYGFMVNTFSSGKVVGHNGGFPGLNSSFEIFLDGSYIVVVLSNYDAGASSLALKLNQLVLGLEN